MKSSVLFLSSILLLAACPLLQAQEPEGMTPFNGLLLDIAGNPLKGARIYVTEHRVAHSNRKGRFGLTNVEPTDTLHILYRKTRYDIPVNGRKSMRITLGDQLMADEDQELISWGYGYVKRRESLEVSSGISGDELRRTGHTNLLEALQGKVAGLNIGPTNGPGDTPSMNIRGLNSIHGDPTPLFVVDGIIVDSLEWVNISDVERVEVLKDASIYGARGANGAILVTTKSGR